MSRVAGYRSWTRLDERVCDRCAMTAARGATRQDQAQSRRGPSRSGSATSFDADAASTGIDHVELVAGLPSTRRPSFRLSEPNREQEDTVMTTTDRPGVADFYEREVLPALVERRRPCLRRARQRRRRPRRTRPRHRREHTGDSLPQPLDHRSRPVRQRTGPGRRRSSGRSRGVACDHHGADLRDHLARTRPHRPNSVHQSPTGPPRRPQPRRNLARRPPGPARRRADRRTRHRQRHTRLRSARCPPHVPRPVLAARPSDGTAASTSAWALILNSRIAGGCVIPCARCHYRTVTTLQRSQNPASRIRWAPGDLTARRHERRRGKYT